MALAVLLITALSITVWSVGPTWLRDLAPNVAAEVLGIFLVVALLDRVLRRRDEIDEMRRRVQGLRQLKRPLRGHAELLLSMHWAAQGNTGSLPAKEHVLSRLRDPTFARVLARLDFESAAPVIPSRTWFAHTATSFRQFRDAITKTIEIYVTWLTVEDIERVDRILGATLPMAIESMTLLPQVDAELGIRREYRVLNGLEPLLEEYVLQIIDVIEYVNLNLPPSERIAVEPPAQ